ncbi:peptidyl-prolyl cis-trans isomerase FKBP1B isoform X1 [Apus apus]|uniref:peptidyl-prolyl cis-trans isomerase FKBP1B isoform X1 n=1 Tax=Apus apus TaxID=8895 RepID=UPI0021F8F8FF|nr:peptidyl-prolyl cis-trans isomerase FKBP1B isoform X1 [Apus apus]
MLKGPLVCLRRLQEELFHVIMLEKVCGRDFPAIWSGRRYFPGYFGSLFSKRRSGHGIETGMAAGIETHETSGCITGMVLMPDLQPHQVPSNRPWIYLLDPALIWSELTLAVKLPIVNCMKMLQKFKLTGMQLL